MVLNLGDRFNLGAASCEAAPFFWRLPLNVYLHGSADKPPVAHHILIVTPAAHLPGAEHPSEFFEADGKPKDFPVDFIHGKAEVPDTLGKYMVAQGLAQKSRLVIPGAWS